MRRKEPGGKAAVGASDTMWLYRDASVVAGLPELERMLVSEPARHLVRTYQTLLEENDGNLPERSGFDPTCLRGHMANAVLYDVTDPERVQFRIVGENMMNHFNINPIGRCYLEFVPQERRSHALAAFRYCADLPCAMLSRTIQVFGSGLHRYCEAIGVPLMGADPDGPATHLLFMDSPTTFGADGILDDSPFQHAQMLERHFVDLGSGVPSGFQDRVLAGLENPFVA